MALVMVGVLVLGLVGFSLNRLAHVFGSYLLLAAETERPEDGTDFSFSKQGKMVVSFKIHYFYRQYLVIRCR